MDYGPGGGGVAGVAVMSLAHATVINAERSVAVANAWTEGEELWLSLEDLTRVSGWELTPEGACLEGLCVPNPAGEGSVTAQRGEQTWVNLSELARLVDQPVVASVKHRVWLFGDRPEVLASRLGSVMAPDFTLPDLEGRLWRLADFLGKKVFLLTWASW